MDNLNKYWDMRKDMSDEEKKRFEDRLIGILSVVMSSEKWDNAIDLAARPRGEQV